MASQEVTNSWPNMPESEEEKQARFAEVSRKMRERFGHSDWRSQSERRCPQCAKKMVVEYAESPNEFEAGTWVQTCWGCGYEAHL